jgi:hypothetical protein
MNDNDLRQVAVSRLIPIFLSYFTGFEKSEIEKLSLGNS